MRRGSWSVFNRLLRAPSRRSTSVNVLKHASLGLPSLGALATPVKHALRQSVDSRPSTAPSRLAAASLARRLQLGKAGSSLTRRRHDVINRKRFARAAAHTHTRGGRVSDQKLVDELTEAREALEQARIKTEAFALLSHEIRTLMSGVIGMTRSCSTPISRSSSATTPSASAPRATRSSSCSTTSSTTPGWSPRASTSSASTSICAASPTTWASSSPSAPASRRWSWSWRSAGPPGRPARRSGAAPAGARQPGQQRHQVHRSRRGRPPRLGRRRGRAARRHALRGQRHRRGDLPEGQAKLFRPFSQVHDGSRGHGGSGLGLAR